MDATVSSARVDILATSGFRGAEMAPDQSTQNLMSGVLHNATIKRMCLMPRLRVNTASTPQETIQYGSHPRLGYASHR